MSRSHVDCPDCQAPVARREFLRGVSGAVAAGGLLPLVTGFPQAYAAPTPQSAAETAVGRLYASLSDAQKAKICLPFDHEKRSRINANWHIVDVNVGSDFYTAEQRKLIDEIIRGVTSPDGYERLQKQMEYDDGGVDAYSVAIFGEPGTDKFQFELTGRHLTLRADGDTLPGAAFGGPIVYGHGLEGNPDENLFHYQTKQTNKVFEALDPAQRKIALLRQAPRESAVELQGQSGRFPGVAVKELSADQQQLVGETLKVLLAPYREEDVTEAMAILEAAGGVGSLHMAFYEQGDLRNDRMWDIWRVEGPSFVWHFRGAPHVHAYINIGQARG